MLYTAYHRPHFAFQTKPTPVLVANLIRACADPNNEEAWKQFVAHFHRDISLSVLRVAQRWGAGPKDTVDDLVQDTYLKLCADKCRILSGFAAEHPEAVSAYVRTIAINVAQDHFKARHSQKRGGRTGPQPFGDIEPIAQSASLGGQDAMEREILFRQVDQCLNAFTEGATGDRDRLVFWLYYQQGMTARAIAALPAVGLTAKGVESLISRLTRNVREHLNNLERSHFQPKGLQQEESYS
jgi:RNA polymerase sigma-70 factor, ECF subfamily